MFQHPQNVCLTYFEHLKFSMELSYIFTKAAACAIIHGIYPDILVTHSSDTINIIKEKMKKIGCRE